MKAFVFPGQGAQFTGMGKDLYQNNPKAKDLFSKANDVLGFDISKIMFEGTSEDLKETKVTQPAIFLHSVAIALTEDEFEPEMVAGHSLGELSALVAAKVISFEDGLKIVSKRAKAMQKACELRSGTMAAILALDDEVVERTCKEVKGVVVAANYNCPGQLVISGEVDSVNIACEKLKKLGAKRALVLPVGGAFHSPLMDPAKDELAEVINTTEFKEPICPVYQNVNAQPVKNPEIIKQNLISQLTSPVRWTQTVKNMLSDGASSFTEIGPGKTLQGLVKKVDRQIETSGIQ
jgi:[acyl-carrier-protein] S-malonyltransferase